MFMKISDPTATNVCPEFLVYDRWLAFDNADVLDLGCGRGEHARAIALSHPRARVTAVEADPIQHNLNIAADVLPNLQFVYGRAEAIPAADESIDIVLMFKSLHHIAVDALDLDRALLEIRRILRPGGLVYVSEPVFGGELNEIVRVFHDEQKVRHDAFAVLRRSVEAGWFQSVEERFFMEPVWYADFAHFKQQIVCATHSNHCLTDSQMEDVRQRFVRHLGSEGAYFEAPLRVALIRKPADDGQAAAPGDLGDSIKSTKAACGLSNQSSRQS